jgi:hypothetical protein
MCGRRQKMIDLMNDSIVVYCLISGKPGERIQEMLDKGYTQLPNQELAFYPPKK